LAYKHKIAHYRPKCCNI